MLQMSLESVGLTYTRPNQLPKKVAFKIMGGEVVDNPNKKGENANRVKLFHSDDELLLVYLTNRFCKLTKESFLEMEVAAAAKQHWLLAAKDGVAADSLKLEIFKEAERELKGYPHFDCTFSF